MKTCLLLGANGFVGAHIVDQLATREGWTVKAFDRFSREPQFKNRESVEIIKGDIFDDSDIRQALVGVDYVMHCFSATTPFISDNDPYIDITKNLLRSVKLFELCTTADVKKVGFISSGGAVYGRVTEHHVADEMSAPMPVSPYGINKLAIEHYLEYFKRKQGLEYVVYRLTNPYGPGQTVKNNQGVIPTFIDKIKNQEHLTIYGDGTSSRDYIYVTDAACMIADSFEADSKSSIYNVGSGTQTSLNDIINNLKTVTGVKPMVNYMESPKTFLSHSSVNVDRFFEEFGKRDLTSLEDGLKLTLSDQ